MEKYEKHELTQKEDAPKIKKQLEDMGLQVTQSGDCILYGFSGDLFVVTFHWVPKQGWRVDLTQPVAYTKEDLDLVLNEVCVVFQAIERVSETWRAYLKNKTKEMWMRYQGELAAHYLRHWARRGL